MANKNYGKKSYHKNYRLRKVRVANSFAIGALGALDVVADGITSAPTERIRVISANLTWSLADMTPTDDAVEVGFAHGDYTAAEIEECLEAQSAIDAGDKIGQEKTNRLVRTVGVFPDVVAAGGGQTLNDGRPIKTRLNWALQTGKTLNVFVRNGSGTVYTTGGKLITSGEIWVKD